MASSSKAQNDAAIAAWVDELLTRLENRGLMERDGDMLKLSPTAVKIASGGFGVAPR